MNENLSLKKDLDAYMKRMLGRSNQQTDVEKRNMFYSWMLEKNSLRKIILLQSNNGFSPEGSVLSLYNYMRSQEKWKDYKFIWVVKSKRIHEEWKKYYKEIVQSKCIYAGTKVYFYYLSVASVIISDTRMPACFIPRENQKYVKADDYFVNTLQGYSLGIDYLDQTSMSEKDYLCATDILSGSRTYTENVLYKSWLLKGTTDGTIHQGYSPRLVDIAKADKKMIKEKLSYLGIEGNKKLLLCNFGLAGSFQTCSKKVKNIAGSMSERDIQVIVKVPANEIQLAQNKLKGSKAVVAPDFVNSTMLLAAADYVIGDQGKYTYDFLASEGELMFWKMRGNDFLIPDELPGVFIEEESDLLNVLDGNYDKAEFDNRKKKWCELLNIPSAEDSFLDHQCDLPIKDDRKNLLLMIPRVFATDDIYSEWENDLFKLISVLDTEKYNITFLAAKPREVDGPNWLGKHLNGKLRILYRSGANIQRKKPYYQSKFIVNNLLSEEDVESIVNLIPASDMERQLKRSCGNVNVDCCAFFGQFEPNLFMILHSIQCNKKVVFDVLHYNAVNFQGDDENSIEARNVMKLYQYFDTIVHPSKDSIDLLEARGFLGNKEKHVVFVPTPNMDVVRDMKENVMVKMNDSDSLLCNYNIGQDGRVSGTLLARYCKESYHVALPITPGMKVEESNVLQCYEQVMKGHKNVQFYVFDPSNAWNESLTVKLAHDSKSDVVIIPNDCNEDVVSAFDEVILLDQEMEGEESKYYYLCSLFQIPLSFYNGKSISIKDKKMIQMDIDDKIATLF